MVKPLWPADRAKLEKKKVLRLTSRRSVTIGTGICIKLAHNVDSAKGSNFGSRYLSINPIVKPLWPADRGHPRILQIKIEQKTVLRLTNQCSVPTGAAIRVKFTHCVDKSYSYN
jgi:hypothetical protein